MATTSTNLSLRKPESTDFVSVSLDLAANFTTIDDKWASSAAANIGSAAAAGTALTVARTDHVHAVGSGTVSAPGLPVGESNTGLYRIGTGQLGVTIAGALIATIKSIGIVIEAAFTGKYISTPAAPAAGYLALYSKSATTSWYKETPAAVESLILDASIVTANHDLIEGTASNTVARFATGTSTQVLHGANTWSSIATADIAANAVTQRTAAVTGSTDPTTTSASAVALADPTKTITTTGGDVLVWVRTTINCSVAAVINLYVRESVANTFVLVGDVSPPSSAGRQTVSGFHLFTGLSAGSHTFDMGWATSAGTATSYGASRRLIALEIIK